MTLTGSDGFLPIATTQDFTTKGGIDSIDVTPEGEVDTVDTAELTGANTEPGVVPLPVSILGIGLESHATEGHDESAELPSRTWVAWGRDMVVGQVECSLSAVSLVWWASNTLTPIITSNMTLQV